MTEPQRPPSRGGPVQALASSSSLRELRRRGASASLALPRRPSPPTARSSFAPAAPPASSFSTSVPSPASVSSVPPASLVSSSALFPRLLHVTALGAGQDVGRSAVCVRVGCRCVMFDCGCHLGMKDARKFPLFDKLASLALEQGRAEKRESLLVGGDDETVPASSLEAERLRKRAREDVEARRERCASLQDVRGVEERTRSSSHSRERRLSPQPPNARAAGRAVSGERDDRGSPSPRGHSDSLQRAASLPRSAQVFAAADGESSFSSSLLSLEALLRQPRGIFSHAVDACVVTHFHLDHCGALPTFTEDLQYRGPVLMTFPTKALSPLLLLDCARVGRDRLQRGRLQQAYDAAAAASAASAASPAPGERERSSHALFEAPHPHAAKTAANAAMGLTRGRGALRSEKKAAQAAVASTPPVATPAPGSLWTFGEGDVHESLRRVKALRLHETWSSAEEEKQSDAGDGGDAEAGEEIQLTPYYAGHVLGAAMFELKIGKTKVVYTGDYNTLPDRHLGSASIPCLRPDVLISECTYASFVRPSKKTVERDFCAIVHDTLTKGGKVLIPVFAVGRAQELCMLLENYWDRMHLEFPIYFAGGMTERANAYYRLYVHWSKAEANADADDEDALPTSAFSFPHILPFQSSLLSAPTPLVLLATPGMLHGGLALKALKAWASEPANLVLLPGYCVRGTVGAMLIAGQRQIPLDGHATLNVKCKVRYMSFSAHADTTGIQQLVLNTQPRSVVLVHGEKEGMERLANVIRKDFNIPVFTPATGQTVSIPVARPQRAVPVYVHLNFLRTAVAAAAAAGAPGQAAGSTQQREELARLVASCTEGDDELRRVLVSSGFASLLGLEPGSLGDARRGSPSLSAGSSPCVVSSGVLPRYFPFLPAPPALLFKLSASGAPPLESSSDPDVAPRADFADGNARYLLVDVETLREAAKDTAMYGAGSLLRHLDNARGSVPSAPSSSSSRMASAEGVASTESSFAACESPASILADFSGTAEAAVPSCLRLHCVRYSKRATIAFAAFRSLLHLFFEYFAQCHAACAQRNGEASGAAAAAPPAELSGPLHLGVNVKVQTIGGGTEPRSDAQAGEGAHVDCAREARQPEENAQGANADEDAPVLVAFLSLVAVHDGRETLRMQWAEEDDHPGSAVFVFVEFFSSFDSTTGETGSHGSSEKGPASPFSVKTEP